MSSSASGSSAGELPFKARVAEFWSWFAANEQRIYDDLQERTLDPDELSERIGSMASLAWELCPSPEEGREGLALSSEGSQSKRILVGAILAAAPPLERWTLFGSKQPSEEIDDAVLELGGGEAFEFSDFWFAVDFDAEVERLHVQVHHPRFSKLPPEARTQLTFIALDNALGENLVESWVGHVEHTPDRTPDQKYDIAALRRQARAALSLHDFDPELDPGTQWTSYSRNEPGDGDLVARDDVFTGMAWTTGPIRGLTDPDYDDELAGTGACFAYVMLPRLHDDTGQELDRRSGIQDVLERTLQESGVGDLIGGALGTQYTYVDLVLFDERAAIERIRDALAGREGFERATLRYFASARRDEHDSLLA